MFFLMKDLTPQPIQNMLSVFIAAVVISEITAPLFRKRQMSNFAYGFPLMGVVLMLLPYRDTFQYFSRPDQLLISGIFLLSLVYFADRKFLYARMLH
jgi:hypothetical protein